jgi:carboxypeptidase Taq
MTAYTELETRFRRLAALQEAASILHWDSSTMMPEGAGAGRAEQLATLRVLAHERLTDPALGDLIDAAAAEQELGPWQKANLAEMRRRRVHATSLPAPLVEALSKACSECEREWRRARPGNDFAGILPKLERVLSLVREAAAAKAERLGKSAYDALLDEYEPGGSTADIDRLFGELARFLPGFIAQAIERQAARPAPIEPAGPFPVEKQRALGLELMRRVGFDFAHGRLDISLHPFCGGTPDDVRITTRYDEADFRGALMGVLHETGHALYERGLPAEWRFQPVGDARGMAMHESQSLLMEMQACRSREFAEFLAPLLAKSFGGAGPAWEAENLYRLGIQVRRSLIRVDADEVTYPAHVILRYRLERAMIAGDLALADLPAAWNDGMKELLGIVPPDDREGCLQDIHWYDGAWGYFPTYTMGALIAAQLFDAARRAHPELSDDLRCGDFSRLLAWLREHVHGKGSSRTTAEIVAEATGRPLDAAVFEAHLRRRYLED